MNISVASIMDLVDGYKFLNARGMLLSITFLDGHIGTLNLEFIQVEEIRETLDCEI